MQSRARGTTRGRVAVALLGLATAALGQERASAAAPSASAYATALAEDINAYRAARNLRPATLDPALSRLASEHSEAMAAAGTMGHDGFPGRVQRSGFAMCVENVGWNYPSAQAQFDAWRASPGHDRNMQHAGVEKLGIGVVRGYVTLIACGA